IGWGTVAVVLLLAIGGGFHAASKKAMHGMGEHLVVIWLSRTTKAYEGMQPGRQITMKSSDVVEMGRALPEIGLYSPEPRRSGLSAQYDNHRVKVSVSGVTPGYGIMRNMIPEPGGRFFNDRDVKARRRVAFIGNKVKSKLFDEGDPIGQIILLDGRPFTVIGTLQEKTQTSDYGGRDAGKVVVPYTTYTAMWGDQNVRNIVVRPNPVNDSEPMKKAIYTYLSQKYRFDPTDEGALSIWDTVEMDRFTDWFFWGLQALLGLGGALTLCAGGIGVANVMFLIVRERTREIGLRMAVGARDWHILLQVMLEAGLIVALGGLGGLSFSFLVIWAIQAAPTPEWLGQPQFSPLVSLITISVLAFVGLISGIFPARRAARLDPVKALEF
ncbi:MAG: ABC transporter permease, partial [Candidatus Latescibacteria bacterium]|nr:ABC transporter permease [Candidatus Latescibacterota bacterium]